MKLFTKLFALGILLVSFSYLSAQTTQSSSQYSAEELKNIKVDTRIDNMGYWRRCAEHNLVPVAPNVLPEKAIFTGSKINARTVITDDSPDVPVTELNSTQSENSIFVNPWDNDNVLNSNNSTQNPVGQLYGANDFFSFDAGLNWDGELEGAGGTNQGDPAACIGMNGWYYAGQIKNDGQAVAYSTDMGATWTTVQVADGPGGFNSLLDKNHLWIDNSLLSPYNGQLYDAWTNFSSGAADSEIEISYTADNGLNWSTPTIISAAVNAGSHNQGVNIQTGPYGEVYVVWTIYDNWPQDENAMGFAKSLDGGATWEPAYRIIENIKGIRNTETSKNHRVNSFPSMTVDLSDGPRKGTIYVVWPNVGVPGVNQGPEIDVYMIKSSDGGASWSDPVRVNQDPAGQGKEHYFSWIACDPVTGTLSVVFYDDRNVISSQCEVFCANSYDGGETWEDFKVSDIAFSPSPIPGLAGGYMGDYLGIDAHGGKVYPVWTDNRAGAAMTYVSPYETGSPPNKPVSPSPYNNELEVLPFTQLHWKDGFGEGDSATSYQVFFGTNNPPNNIINGEMISDTFYILPQSLAHETWHYWKIIAFNDFGAAVGSVWGFKTTTPPNEDFESGDFSQLNWYSGGEADWMVDGEDARSGTYSAKAGDVDVGESSSLNIDLDIIGFGSIDFSVKVNLAEGNTLQAFAGPTLIGEWTGNTGWLEESAFISPDTYTFSWVYTKNNASDTDEARIDYINFPPSPILTVNAGLDDITCEGVEYELSGDATYYSSVLWTTSGDGVFNDPTLLDAVYIPGEEDGISSSTTLTLTAYNADGDSVTDEKNLTVNPAPDVYVGEDGFECLGYDFYLQNTEIDNVFFFSWGTYGDGVFNDTTTLFPVYTPGEVDIANGGAVLYVTATSYTTCPEGYDEMVFSIIDIPVQPEVPEGPNYVDLYYTTITDYTIEPVEFAETYDWRLSPPDAGTLMIIDTLCSIEWNPDFLGTAYLKVNGVNYCGTGEFSDELEITVNNTVGLADGKDKIGFSIIPNPAKDKIFIQISNGKSPLADLSIIDQSGAVVYEEKNMQVDANLNKAIDISTLKEGIYLVTLKDNNSTVSRKLVVMP